MSVLLSRARFVTKSFFYAFQVYVSPLLKRQFLVRKVYICLINDSRIESYLCIGCVLSDFIACLWHVVRKLC
jgi:hypothetical protein